jgi:leucyl aminopeptidase
MKQKAFEPLKNELPSFLAAVTYKNLPNSLVCGHVHVFGIEDRPLVKKIIEETAPSWQCAGLLKQIQREVIHYAGTQGPVWIFSKSRNAQTLGVAATASNLGWESEYSWHRDQAGGILGYARAYRLHGLQFEFYRTSTEQELGFFVGMELSGYSFKAASEFPSVSVRSTPRAPDSKVLAQAKVLGQSINWARHLVNCSPNILNPESFARFLKNRFLKSKNIKVQVWDQKRLEKEGMGLHLGVGQGSSTPPCLVHLRYRPKLKKASQPIAFVGKGISFDTGGLDIKPSAGMRLMKKDMGGAAALAGLAFWIDQSRPSVPIDIYLALAENSVDAESMRPSDILKARSGALVEIHNTDAEGRLVLADALDVAVTQKGGDEPKAIIDVATLTGAIKVALGGDVAGLFCNNEELAKSLHQAGLNVGEPNWRMPLVQKYGRGMDTSFADFTNCVDGFGGAITAALFLEKFVKNKPWAHLDIYGWNDKASGGLGFSGGNGQAVQTLVEYLKTIS